MLSKVIKEIRSGHVRLTVWEHQDPAGSRKSISLTRLYKGKEGKWEYTPSLKPQDLLDLVAVALEANKFLRMEDRWSGLSRKEGLVRKNPASKP